MIARAGASVSLSVLIVAVAAVVVHRPEADRLTAAISSPSKPDFTPTEPVRAVPRVTPVATPPRPPREPESHPEAIKPSSTAPSPVTRTKIKTKPRRPEAAFTKVAKGETLADVVRRIYGEGGDVQAVWEANRDQLFARDANLRAGMILRTPEF